MPSDNDAPTPVPSGPGNTPVLVWVVIAILVAVGVGMTVGQHRVEATIAVIVFLVAAGFGRSLYHRLTRRQRSNRTTRR